MFHDQIQGAAPGHRQSLTSGQHGGDRGRPVVDRDGRSAAGRGQGQDVERTAVVVQYPVVARRRIAKSQPADSAGRVEVNRIIGGEIQATEIGRGVLSVCNRIARPIACRPPQSTTGRIDPSANRPIGRRHQLQCEQEKRHASPRNRCHRIRFTCVLLSKSKMRPRRSRRTSHFGWRTTYHTPAADSINRAISSRSWPIAAT